LAEVWHRLASEYSLPECAGVLFDFGTSSEQLTSTERGLSFFGDETAELDMRLDERLGVKAKDLLLLLSERDLAQIFREYGGEEQSRSIAREIVTRRKQQDLEALTTVGGFVNLITSVKKSSRGHLHPATKVFQALRIAVNDELGNIDRALPQALSILPSTGRIVTIAFHEGEDRIVKKVFREWERQSQGLSLYKHPLTPSETEVARNSKARSGKLRAFEKK
jgi:16S rRNA (cytosine1402-N4)-methyltransferase